MAAVSTTAAGITVTVIVTHIYRSGHGYGYWRGGIWIGAGVIGYGAGSYCSRLYYYDYNRWLYECR